MKIASWNVNSLSVRLPQVLEWLQQSAVDVLCLQELKMETHKFPSDEFMQIGYHSVASGQKAYNGVAILSKASLSQVQINNPLFKDDQQRLIAADIQGVEAPVRVIGVYGPNGSTLKSDKFTYKMAWFDALQTYLQAQLSQYSQLVLTGDFNIAPDERDVHAKYSGDILVSPAERAHFQALLDLGLVDSFRLFEQAEKSFSWWDYRQFGFKRNAGLRIDHLLISKSLQALCQSSTIDRQPRANERPSDHTPVIVELSV